MRRNVRKGAPTKHWRPGRDRSVRSRVCVIAQGNHRVWIRCAEVTVSGSAVSVKEDDHFVPGSTSSPLVFAKVSGRVQDGAHKVAVGSPFGQVKRHDTSSRIDFAWEHFARPSVGRVNNPIDTRRHLGVRGETRLVGHGLHEARRTPMVITAVADLPTKLRCDVGGSIGC